MKKIVLAVIAHVDSGKTTLTESMMYCSGNIKKRGRVDHGDSLLDTNALERDRGITIFSKQAIMNYGDTRFTLLDTPGHVDFSAETERTLSVPDYAVLVISGTDGVQGHTRTLWRLLAAYNIPCFVFVNKMDSPGADKTMVEASVKNNLGEGFVDFSQTGDSFFEEVAVCDEELLDEYSETGTISRDSIVLAIKNRRIFPVIYGSALRLERIDEFLSVLDTYTVMPSYPEEFSARVFKISEDKQKNRLTFMKITGGSLKVRDILQSEKNKENEKATQIRIYSGDKFTSVDSVSGGDICAVTGISFASPGDGLGSSRDIVLPILEPVLNYSVIIPKQINTHKAFEDLKLLEQGDPKLSVFRDERSGDIQIKLMGEIQIEVLKSVINERFGWRAEFGNGKIIYKETVKNTVEGIGHFEPLRHYAEVHLLIKPAERNSGIKYSSACREELLSAVQQRLIISQLSEKNHIGVLTGSPVTDLEVILISGKDHIKHTEGGDLREAAYRALRQGLRRAECVLLEPFYEFTIEVTSSLSGRIMTDIKRMCGRFSPPETIGETTVINGFAPVSELRVYQTELLRFTSGQGRISMIFSGYEECHNTQEVIDRFDYDPDSDTDNPCDSVFCSHGAGHIVKWNEVPEHAHISSVIKEEKPTGYERVSYKKTSEKDPAALDRELQSIFESTYGKIRRKNTETPRIIDHNTITNTKKSRPQTKKYSGREYVLVDGYNVIYEWEELLKLTKDGSFESARNRLINILCNYRGYKKCELILVFDAYKVKGHDRETEKINGINIVYTKEAETADMYIEKVSHELARDNRVRVVTSDGAEQLIILGNGALRVSSAAFQKEVEQAEREIREIIENNQSK